MGINLSDITNPLIRKQIQSQLIDTQQKPGVETSSSTSKYKNEKDVRIIGNKKYVFDSKREAKCFDDLYRQQQLGIIKNLKTQPSYELIPTLKHGDKTLRKISYIADFTYIDQNGNKIVVDAKGFQTDVYKLKKRLFIMYYPNHILREV